MAHFGKRVLLEEVAEIQTGISKSSKRQYKDSIEIPYLRVANVQDGHLDLTEIKTIEVEQSQIERYKLRYKDVLLTEGGDFDKLGRGTIWKDEISECVHQNHIFVVRPDPKKLLPEYLSLITSSSYGKQYFISCSKQSTNLASINSTQLKQFPINLPPVNEQQKIAEILSTWDEAIEKLERLVELKEREFNILISKLYSTNNELQQLKLDDVASVISGNSFSSNDYLDAGIPLVRISNIKPDFSLSFSECAYLPNEFIDKYTNFTVNKFDLLIALSGATTGKMAMNIDQQNMLLNQRVGLVRTKNPEKTDQLFLSFYLKTLQNKLLDIACGGAQPNLSINDLKKINIYLPEIGKQQRIGQALFLSNSELEKLSFYKKLMKDQKQGLMQKLLTGKVRVKV